MTKYGKVIMSIFAKLLIVIGTIAAVSGTFYGLYKFSIIAAIIGAGVVMIFIGGFIINVVLYYEDKSNFYFR